MYKYIRKLVTTIRIKIFKNKVHNLKIIEDFYLDLLSGSKKYEVRKMNKNYIQRGDYIQFSTLEGKPLGLHRVKKTMVASQHVAMKMSKHEKTNRFIVNEYLDQKLLFCFSIYR